MQIFVASLQAVNLLILSPVDEGHLCGWDSFQASPAASPGSVASRLFIASRGIGTPWVIKNIPQHPKVLAA
ncbi:uncharacterized protein G6M90_00g061640 [Metarhizium brunneum]|uniref:Uncharacterized protein n=1 Tax=Metarhizium brunneum TaxID=500148 RepID=A0A7D5UZJ5_9HYPO